MIISNAERKTKQDISMCKKRIAMYYDMATREEKLLHVLESNLKMAKQLRAMEEGGATK